MTTLKLSRAKWVTTIQDAALKINTSPSNVRALIDLGFFQTLKLTKIEVIPNDELKRFMMANLGVDLSEAIKAEIDRKKREKEASA